MKKARFTDSQIITILKQAGAHALGVWSLHSEPVEITRRDGCSAVVISKAEFEAYQNAKLDAEFDAIMQRHGHTVEALTNR